MKIYHCDNGNCYTGPQRSCLFCKHCTDLFWDYTHGPYMFYCELGPVPVPCEDCDSFQDDPDDPNIMEVKE